METIQISDEKFRANVKAATIDELLETLGNLAVENANPTIVFSDAHQRTLTMYGIVHHEITTRFIDMKAAMNVAANLLRPMVASLESTDF